jgi:hypothetical protein
VKQTLWLPWRLPGQNEIVAAAKGAGGTGRHYATLKAKLTNDIALHAYAAKLKPVPRAYFHFLWHEKNRQRDPDNISAGKKFILDSLVVAKVLENDGWGQVEGWSDRFLVSASVGVLVTIESP